MNEAICQHRSSLILFQVMACRLMAPSQYLNQFWSFINMILWHSLLSCFVGSAHDVNLNDLFKKLHFWNYCHISKGLMSQRNKCGLTICCEQPYFHQPQYSPVSYTSWGYFRFVVDISSFCLRFLFIIHAALVPTEASSHNSWRPFARRGHG